MRLFSATEGLCSFQPSSQNIDRIVSIFRASKRTGRRLVIDLYTAAILEATDNENIPQSDWPEVALFVPQVQRIQIKKHAWFDLLSRHASNRIYIESLERVPRNSTLLFRPLHCPDLEGCTLKGAAYIYSQWEGYWQCRSIRSTEGVAESSGDPDAPRPHIRARQHRGSSEAGCSRQSAADLSRFTPSWRIAIPSSSATWNLMKMANVGKYEGILRLCIAG